MILIPQRLFENKNVNVILRDGNVCILSKELTEPVVNRQGYISNHVISIWLKEKRMDKAMAILKQEEMSVTELAYEVGYENISYFIKEFSNKYGQTPKQYILSLHRNRLEN